MSDSPVASVSLRPPAGASLDAAVTWLAARHLRAIVFLVLVSLACFLPGLTRVQPIDRDEARFAQATKQMLETGELVDIRMHDEPRYKKPVGIYWLQAALVTLTGQGPEAGIWAYRLASVVGALSAVLLLYWATLALFDRRGALIAAALFSCSLIVTIEAHLAKTDAVLVATVILAQGALARVYLWNGPDRPPILTALLFWVGIGIGFLIKGPVIVMVSGLTVLALVLTERRWRWLKGLRPLIGIPLAAAIILPWFVAILSIAGLDFLNESVGNDLLGKVATGQEDHGAPPGTHLLLFFAIFWPGVVLAPIAVPWVWRNRREAPVRFCLAWIIPSWIVFEVVATKLPHYTLPLYPAIAALIGGAAVAGFGAPRLLVVLSVVAAAIGAVVLPSGGVAALAWLEGIVSFDGIVVIMIVAVLAIGAVALSFRGLPLAAAALLGATALISYQFMLGEVLPRLETFRISPRLADAVQRAAPCADPEVVATGYEEPSLIFLVGTKIRFENARGAADFLAEPGCRVAIVDGRQVERFTERARKIGLDLERSETVNGLNVGHFRDVAIAVYRPAKPLGP